MRGRGRGQRAASHPRWCRTSKSAATCTTCSGLPTSTRLKPSGPRPDQRTGENETVWSRRADAAYLRLCEDRSKIRAADSVRIGPPGATDLDDEVALDFDAQGHLVGIEVLIASRRLLQEELRPGRVEAGMSDSSIRDDPLTVDDLARFREAFARSGCTLTLTVGPSDDEMVSQAAAVGLHLPKEILIWFGECIRSDRRPRWCLRPTAAPSMTHSTITLSGGESTTRSGQTIWRPCRYRRIGCQWRRISGPKV